VALAAAGRGERADDRPYCPGLTDSAPSFGIVFFKQYNDLCGHKRGDRCLIDIAQTLSQALDGPRDIVARYGGEEFVVLLPQAGASVALKLAERCQQLIHKQVIPHAQSPHDQRITVSIVVGTIVPDAQTTPSSFIDPAGIIHEAA